MKVDTKNIIKIIGNIVTILAIFFVLKKLISSDIDYSTLFQFKNIIPVLIIVIIQSIIVITNNYPWKKLVELFSNVSIPFKDSIVVYVKSNLLKYVPGNVFQYVGRNGLAVKKGIPHIEVASATLVDVGMTVLSALLISIFFLYDYIFTFIVKNNYVLYILLGILAFLVILAIIFFLFKEKVTSYFSKYAYLLHPRSLKTIFICLFYYIIVMMISSLMYIITLVYILDVPLDFSLFLKLFSAYTLSWLVGFITPGAPAGIGIKEAVMVGVTGGLLNISTITLSMVILRVLTTISDALAFIIIIFWNKFINKEETTTKTIIDGGNQ